MELIFATHNANKVKEIKNQLGEGFNVKSLNEINFLEDIPETENTLEGNALLKVRAIHKRTGLNCFADDTGLEVEALDGAPGVYSARYAGESCDANDNMDLLLENLRGEVNRSARFRTVVMSTVKNILLKEFVKVKFFTQKLEKMDLAMILFLSQRDMREVLRKCPLLKRT